MGGLGEMALREGDATWSAGLLLGGAGRVALPAMTTSGDELSISAWVYLTSDFEMPIVELHSDGLVVYFGVHGQHAKAAVRTGANNPTTASWTLSNANYVGASRWHLLTLALSKPASSSSTFGTLYIDGVVHTAQEQDLGSVDLDVAWPAFNSSIGMSRLACTPFTGAGGTSTSTLSASCGAGAGAGASYGLGRLKHVALFPSAALSKHEVMALYGGHAGGYPYPCTGAASAPALTYGYSRPNASYYKAEAITPNVVCNYGDEARFFLEDEDELPAGLSFATADGTLSGTPTCPGNPSPCFGERAFAVVAYNSAGAYTTEIDLKVVHRPPQLGYYAAKAPVYDFGAPIATNDVANVGGVDGVAFSIVNATPNGLVGGVLPGGLSFSPTTGTLAGTPSQGAPVAKYLVTAQNDGGASVTPLWITVTEPPPNITLGFEPLKVRTSKDPMAYVSHELPGGQSNTQIMMEMGDALPNGRVLLRGEISESTLFNVYPPLPAGLSIVSQPEPALVGSPTASTNNVTTWYTVRALTSSGVSYASIELNVLPPPPHILGLVGGETVHAIKGLPIDERPLNSSGGDGLCTMTMLDNLRGWSNVPPGLALDEYTGVLTGSPEYTRDAYTYRIACTNGGGSSFYDLTLGISDPGALDQSVSVSLGPLDDELAALGREGLKGALTSHIEDSLDTWSMASSQLAPFSCAGRVRVDSLRADLSALFFTIEPHANASATPTEPELDSGRSLVTQLQEQLADSASALMTPAPSTGLPSSGLFTSSLRAAADGSVAGDKEVVLTETTQSVSLGDPIDSAFAVAEVSYTKGLTISANTLDVNFAISQPFFATSPALPAGLSLNPLTGSIEGTPTAEAARIKYKVKAENYADKAYSRLYLSVPNPTPVLGAYTRATSTYVRGANILPNTVANTGGGKSTVSPYTSTNFFSVDVSAPLPAGLIFDPDTGTISGAPSEAKAMTTYTITATNSGGQSTTTVAFEVVEGVPFNDAETVSPESGPIAGGTVIVLRTSGSDRFVSNEPPVCYFGSSPTTSTWINLNDGTFSCTSPAHNSAAAQSVTVSLQGSSGRADALSFAPPSGPVSFQYYDTSGDLDNAALQQKSLTMRGGNVQTTWSTCPVPAPTSAVTRMRVDDEYGLFVLEDPTSCSGTQFAWASVGCQITCALPDIGDMELKPRRVSLEIALNGQQFFRHYAYNVGEAFQYTDTMDPILESISPLTVAAGKNISISLTGSSFQPATEGSCVANASCAGVPFLPDVSCVGDSSLCAGVPNGTFIYKPALQLDNELRCAVPQSMLSLTAANGCIIDFSVMNSGNRRSNPMSVTLFDVPMALSIAPLVGPTAGGTTITISGTGLDQTSLEPLTVRFGATERTGTLVGSTVTAVSPVTSSVMDSTIELSLNGQQYSTGSSAIFTTFTITSMKPRAVPAGKTVPITIALSGLGNSAQTAGWSCKFLNSGGASTEVAATFDTSDKTLTCVNPVRAANTTDQLTVKALNSAYTAESTIATLQHYSTFNVLSLSRMSGPKAGGLPVMTVTADYLPRTEDGVYCSFAGRAPRSGVWTSYTTAQCDVPSMTAAVATVTLALTRTDSLDAMYRDPTSANYLFFGNPSLEYVAYGLQRITPSNAPSDVDMNISIFVEGYRQATRTPSSGQCALTNWPAIGSTKEGDVTLVLDGIVAAGTDETELICPVPFGSCSYTYQGGAFVPSGASCTAARAGTLTCNNPTYCAAFTGANTWPSKSAKESIMVKVAMEGQGFTDPAQDPQFTLYPPIDLYESLPPYGPVKGGFDFRANGTNLDQVDAGMVITCRFSIVGGDRDVDVQGSLLPSGVNCPVPANLGTAAKYRVEVSLNALHFSSSTTTQNVSLYQLKTDGTKPKSGPLRGNTTITLGIENPPPCTGTGAACEINCRFTCGSTIHTKSAQLRNNVLEVESDAVTEACTLGTLEITHSGSVDESLYTAPVDFQRFYAPNATALAPTMGPSGGNFPVVVIGSDLSYDGAAYPTMCQWGAADGGIMRSGEASENNTRLSCMMPQLSPSSHALTLSLNSPSSSDAGDTDLFDNLTVTAFTVAGRTPVSIPLNVSRDATLTINGFGDGGSNRSLERLLATKEIAMVCRFANLSAIGVEDDATKACGFSTSYVIARDPADTTVQCPAPVLYELAATNTDGACELSIEVAVFEGADAQHVHAEVARLGNAADLTASLTNLTERMYFTQSNQYIFYYTPPIVTAVEVVTRTLLNTTTSVAVPSSMTTGSVLSAYAFQGGTATVRGVFPHWPESSYLRPNPTCRFGDDATPLTSATHGRDFITCNYAAHKQGEVPIDVSMSGEGDVFYGGSGGVDVIFTYKGCPAGQYAETYTDECTDCPPGKYQDLEGTASCKVAAHDEYTDTHGAITPKKCPLNTNHSIVAAEVVADSIEACICMPNFYSSVIDDDPDIYSGGMPGHACLPCDVNGKGGNCTGGTNLPLALPKFWYDGEHPIEHAAMLDGTPLNGSHPLFKFYMCGEPHPHIKCPGGPPNSCGDGYIERTCIACNSSGTGRFEKDGQCIECPETTQGAIFVLIAMCLVFVVVGLCFLIAIKLAKINVKAFASFSIGVRYWQVISTFGTLNLCWPAPVSGGFSFFNYIAFDLDDYVAQAACAVDRIDQMTKTVAYIVAPLIFMCTVSVAFACIKVVNMIAEFKNSRKSGAAQTHIGQRTVKHLNVCIHAFMYFLNLAYMMLARRVLAIYDCKYYCSLPEYDEEGFSTGCREGHYYLEVDPRMTCYRHNFSSDDEHTVLWTRMSLISLAGVVLYLFGIPGLFLYKLFSNRAYTIFTKSLSMLSEQVEEGDLRPEKAVQRMLELANQFGHKLDRRKKKARRAAQRKENDFLKKHTGTLTNLLQQAHKQFLLTNQSENAPKYAAMKRELVEDVNNIVEQLDARVHLRSRYGFLLARWRPTAFYWELVIMMQKLALAILASHLKSHMVISAICAQFVVFVAFALQLHFNPYETAQDNRLDFYVCLSSEIVLFSGVLFQQTAGPDCNSENNQIGPGSVAMREALGWINVAFMIGTTLMILWQLGKNVSFRARKMALMAAGLGPEAGGAGGASRMHAGHSAYDRDSKRRAETHFLLGARDGSEGAPISDEELASAKAEAAAKNDVWVAASESDFRFMNLWMEASLPLDPLDERQQTPLMVASHAGATYMCALLIAKGADVRLQDRDGWTCLHHAVDAGHEKTVEYLCSRGTVPLDAQATTNGFTALHITAFHDMRKLAAILLDAGASVGLKSTDGKTPVQLANERGSNRFLASVADKGKEEKRHTAAAGANAGKGRFHVRV